MVFLIALAALVLGLGAGLYLTRLLLQRQQSILERQQGAAVQAGVAAALAERGATAEALRREREATVTAAVDTTMRVAENQLGQRLAAGSQELEHRSRTFEQALAQRLEQADGQLEQRSDRFEQTLAQRLEQANAELEHRSKSFEQSFAQQVAQINGELHKVNGLVQGLQKDRARQHGQLVEGLEQASRVTEQLGAATSGLQQALSNPKMRGQWGERMAEDVLRLAGFQEGVNYVQQQAMPGGTVPDFTFMLPRGMQLNMDVKFPIANYQRFIEAEGDVERDRARGQFARDVRDRIKELGDRGYIDPEITVGVMLLFIPNEAIYSFIHENDAGIGEQALRQKVVLCSPFTLFAVLAVIRQAMDNFMLERTGDEILECLNGFNKEWDKFTGQLEKVDKHLTTLTNSFGDLNGPRRRQLERPLNRIEELQERRGIESEEGDGRWPPLREVNAS